MSKVEIKNGYKAFGQHQVINNFSYVFKDQAITAITGKSGSGKTTILNLIGLLDRLDQGEIILFGQSQIRPNSRQAKNLLLNKIGYLFQNYALIDEKTVEYNLGLVLSEKEKSVRQKRIAEALSIVEMTGSEMKIISECSGGEQQRIAIARLLLKPCDLILADEPTGSLDEDNKWKIMNLLTELRNQGKTIIMVTHDKELLKYCDDIVDLQK